MQIVYKQPSKQIIKAKGKIWERHLLSTAKSTTHQKRTVDGAHVTAFKTLLSPSTEN